VRRTPSLQFGRTLCAVVAAAALAAAAPGVAAAQSDVAAPATPAAGPRVVENLNRPGTSSYWAFVNKPAIAREEPSTKSKAVTRLKLTTPDGTDNLVLVLAQTQDAAGRTWLEVNLPMRPNNTTGWVPEQDLGSLQPVDTWLKISSKTLKATLIKKGKVVFSARVGVGKPGTVTPRGNFYIRDKMTSFNNPAYGPVAFATSALSATLTDWPGGGVVGVHGTDEPGLIPGRPSHGCVRMQNRDILRLAKLMSVGTPVTIS